MTSSRKTPGRPRLYESSSEKVGAFRSRVGQAGYSRKEVLVTQETALRLAEIAREEGVPVTDVASALLEHGLRVYDSRRLLKDSFVHNAAARSVLQQAASGSRAARPASPPSPGAAQAPESPEQSTSAGPSDAASPIQNFFARRKESLHGKKS